MLAMMSVLICVFSLGTNAAQGVRAGLLMRLSTRTGPGTQYDEPGTYYQNTWNTAQVQVINSAWDDHNDIWWVQVDFAASGKKFRAYTGLKRVNVDINSLYQEQALGNAVMTSAARAYWGPGRDYVEAKYNVPNHTSVTVYDAENGYVQVEFYDARTATSSRSLRRAWVTASAVSGRWVNHQSSVSDRIPSDPGSGSYRFCPYCRSDLGPGNAFSFCPYCGNALWNSSVQAGQTPHTGLPQKPWAGAGRQIYLKSLPVMTCARNAALTAVIRYSRPKDHRASRTISAAASTRYARCSLPAPMSWPALQARMACQASVTFRKACSSRLRACPLSRCWRHALVWPLPKSLPSTGRGTITCNSAPAAWMRVISSWYSSKRTAGITVNFIPKAPAMAGSSFGCRPIPYS